MNKATWSQIRAEVKQTYTALPSLLILLVDVLLLAASWLLATQGSWVGWLAGQALLVVALIHLYVIHHEAVHLAVFSRRVHNEAIGHLLSLIIGLPFLPRRESHLSHHSWSGSMGDPTHQRMITYLSRASTAKLKRFDLMWSLYIPFIAFNERLALWRLPFMAWRKGERDKTTRQQVLWQTVYLAGYVVAAVLLAISGLLLPFLLWFLPASFLLLVIEENINLPHHIDAPLIDTPKPLSLWEQDATTHSCDTIPFWSDWVLLNFNLHTAHHLFPWVPWYKLPQTQAQLEQHSADLGHENTDEFSWLIQRRSQSFTTKFQAFIQR